MDFITKKFEIEDESTLKRRFKSPKDKKEINSRFEAIGVDSPKQLAEETAAYFHEMIVHDKERYIAQVREYSAKGKPTNAIRLPIEEKDVLIIPYPTAQKYFNVDDNTTGWTADKLIKLAKEVYQERIKKYLGYFNHEFFLPDTDIVAHFSNDNANRYNPIKRNKLRMELACSTHEVKQWFKEFNDGLEYIQTGKSYLPVEFSIDEQANFEAHALNAMIGLRLLREHVQTLVRIGVDMEKIRAQRDSIFGQPFYLREIENKNGGTK